jgi:hypothetical protein
VGFQWCVLVNSFVWVWLGMEHWLCSQALVTEFEGWASVDTDSSMQFDWDDLAGEQQFVLGTDTWCCSQRLSPQSCQNAASRDWACQLCQVMPAGGRRA